MPLIFGMTIAEIITLAIAVIGALMLVRKSNAEIAQAAGDVSKSVDVLLTPLNERIEELTTEVTALKDERKDRHKKVQKELDQLQLGIDRLVNLCDLSEE